MDYNDATDIEKCKDFDVFKKNRIVYLKGEINESKVNDTVKSLITLDLSANKDILLIIDSYGGYVDSFIAIHDTIKMLKNHVSTFCIGKAMSCAFLLLISGQEGKRFISRNSRIMVHEIFSSAHGKYSEIENDLKETERLQNLIEDLLAKYTKIEPKKINKFMSKDTYLDANKSLKYGCVDFIVDKYEEMFKKLNI